MDGNRKRQNRRKSIAAVFAALMIFAVCVAGTGKVISPKIFGNNLPVEQGGECGLVFWRNRRIDCLNPEISTIGGSVYSKNDIDSAIVCVKEHFKNRKNHIGLLKIAYNSVDCDSFRDGYYAIKKYGRKNLIIILCDFTVYRESGGFSTGTYSDWAMILARDSIDRPWRLIDQGY